MIRNHVLLNQLLQNRLSEAEVEDEVKKIKLSFQLKILIEYVPTENIIERTRKTIYRTRTSELLSSRGYKDPKQCAYEFIDESE